MPTDREIKEKLIAVATLVESGHDVTNIFEQPGVSRRMVFKVKKLLKSGEGLDTKPKAGQPKSARSKANIKKATRLIKNNPRTSISLISKKIGVSSRSGDRIIKNDLKARSNKIREVPSVGMSAADRLERTRKLLSYVKSKGSSPKAKTRKCEFSVMKNFLSVIKY